MSNLILSNNQIVELIPLQKLAHVEELWLQNNGSIVPIMLI
jgi:Leucine-rich repeat (LRR) protein